ncbi:MAG: 2-succinyl-6-hydroxy-2,4-cyclohexadiene-1-carboxylate synthase [Firmicutes bacterium]|nr:2-succinyl-6-hydroxy-2,4-cyclohexadiene-1-carboxylate synthase [Bacillota bacterium]
MRVPVDGVEYRVRVEGRGTPVLLLHGFTGSLETWDPFVPAWARRFQVIAVDLLGHGETRGPLDAARYRMERCAADLAALIERLAAAPAHVLGYSMGGRAALHLALLEPRRIRTLVLESASAGIADPAERGARVRHDEELARSIEREGVAAFVERWERLPLFASQAGLPAPVREAVRAQRLRQRPEGLAYSLRGMGAGAQQPLFHRLAELAVPALLIAGELDEKYRVLMSQMAASMPNARAVVVAGAGHAVHLERPEEFACLAEEFWREQEAAAAGR